MRPAGKKEKIRTEKTRLACWILHPKVPGREPRTKRAAIGPLRPRQMSHKESIFLTWPYSRLCPIRTFVELSMAQFPEPVKQLDRVPVEFEPSLVTYSAFHGPSPAGPEDGDCQSCFSFPRRPTSGAGGHAR